MSLPTNLDRDFGILTGTVRSLEREITEVKEAQQDMAKDLKSIQRTLSKLEGSKTALFWLFGAAAALGGLMAKLLPLFNK